MVRKEGHFSIRQRGARSTMTLKRAVRPLYSFDCIQIKIDSQCTEIYNNITYVMKFCLVNNR